MLESGPLSDPEFPKFASSVVLFLHNSSTSSRQEALPDEKYPRLLGDKGFNSFPTICFMDAEGNVLSKPPRSVPGMVESHAQTKKVVDLRAKGDKATAAEQKDLFLAELKLGLVKAPDIQPRADKLTLSADEKAYVAAKLVDVEAGEILAKAREAGPEKTGAALATLLAGGKSPSDEVDYRFWSGVLGHASKQKDAKLAKRAYDTLEKRLGKEKQLQRAFEAWKKLLDEASAQ